MRARLLWPFLLSGCAGLIYQTAWARLLRLAFGATSEALATVLAAFMAGLALGSVVGGRLAGRHSPRALLRGYARLEVGIAALALLSAAALAHFPETYAALEQAVGGGRLARALSAGALLVPATMLMGATLPILSRALGAMAPLSPGSVAWLYAINTLGAVLGAFATGFILLPLVGVRASILVAAALNVIAAALVYRLAGSIPDGVSDPDPAERAPAGSAAAPPGARGRRRLLLLSAALSGATALGLEVLWSRTLLLTVGSSTQAFALMLSTFLGGITLGSALYSRFAARLWPDARTAALLQIAIASASLLLLRVATALPFAYVSLWERAHDSAPALILLRLLPSVALMLLPTLLMGANLPALVRAATRTPGSIGADVGSVFAANTLGAILGSLLVGLVALPRLGVAGATALAASIGIAGALAALLALGRPRPRGSAALFGLAAAALALLLWLPAWDPRVMARGISYIASRASEFRRTGQLRAAIESVTTVYARDGAESTVLVYDGGEGEQKMRSFVVNGRHEATSSPNDMRNQYLLGHLPALLHQGPIERGLVIALGSGMTAGCLARHAREVTVVELEPAVVGAARTFAQWNHDVLDDPRVRIVIDDGRHFLLTSAERFDVITVDPIHPSVAGSETLYSFEQYELVRRRLAPGGVAAQWLPLYQMGVEDARTIARTFFEVFPDAQVWVNGHDAILIGGAGAALPPAAELRDRLARPEVAESLAVVRQAGLGTFLAGYALGEPDTARYVGAATVSRDDRPVLEFSLPWQTYRDTVDANLLEIFRFASAELPSPLAGLDAAEQEGVERARAALGFDQVALALRRVGHDDKMQSMFERALELNPDDALARQGLGR